MSALNLSVAPDMATVDTQPRNTEINEYKSHYDLVALEILKFMHQVYNGLKFTAHDFLIYHSDPLSAINAIEKDFDLSRYEKSCIVSVRACLTAMKKNYGHDGEMPTRTQFLRQNLLGLFQSIKLREALSGECRIAENQSALRTKTDLAGNDQHPYCLQQSVEEDPQTLRLSAHNVKKIITPSFDLCLPKYSALQKESRNSIRFGSTPMLESDHQHGQRGARVNINEDADEEYVVVEDPSTLILVL